MIRILLISLLFSTFYYSKALDKGVRVYTCLQRDVDDSTQCNLFFMTENDEHITLTDNGCFVERANNGQLRNYCPLQCQKAEDVHVTQQRPEMSKERCSLEESMGVARRKRDWFFWRSLECALIEAQFEIHCGDIVANESVNFIYSELEGSGQ